MNDAGLAKQLFESGATHYRETGLGRAGRNQSAAPVTCSRLWNAKQQKTALALPTSYRASLRSAGVSNSGCTR